MMNKSVWLACLILAGCAAQSEKPVAAVSSSATYSKVRSLENFEDYVQFLKAKAAAEGVSAATLNSQHNIRYIQKAVDLDRQQAERAARRDPTKPPVVNPNGATNYLNRVLTNDKVDVAERRYWEHVPELEKAARTYGVQKSYLLALWGMESSFGHYQGSYDVLSVLAILAFDGRREPLFSKEFVNAMKMLDRDHIQRSEMLGSWAGAMGQTQFMPSSYLSYAADGDNDGEKNIWSNHYDVFASIARYLSTVGWNDQLPWGVEVSLSQPLPLSEAGTENGKQRKWQNWQAQGIVLKTNSEKSLQNLAALSRNNADLWLVRPDKEAGRAFLVSNNYRTLLHWNRSNYFAISIGMFADRIQERIGIQ